MPFTDPHVSVTQVDGVYWELNKELRYRVPGTRRIIVVPEGYETDFATVPRLVWWLVPTYGDYTAATVLHDALITDFLPDGAVSSRETDKLFREAMAELGVSVPRRWLMWAGVRWGAVFNKKRRAGSLGTFLGVLTLSALALPFVLPAVALLPSLVLFNLLERLTK